jgi:hypothetical protein
MIDGTTASYTAMICDCEQPQPRAGFQVDDVDEDNNNGPATGLKVLSSVEFAHLPGMTLIK